jgi:thiol:disulfide interchange protein DsbD
MNVSLDSKSLRLHAKLLAVVFLTVAALSTFADAQKVTVTSDFKLKPDSQQGMIYVRAQVPAENHIYSLTQKPGGPTKSKIQVAATDQFKLIGDFKPQKAPHIAFNKDFKIDVEEHEDLVVWQAPIEVAAGVDAATLKIPVEFKGLMCGNGPAGVCRPAKASAIANFKGFDAQLDKGPASAAGKKAKFEFPKIDLVPYQPDETHVTLTGAIGTTDGSKTIKPGDKLALQITATPLDGYHVYSYETTKERMYKPTLVAFNVPAGWKISGPTASAEPDFHDEAYSYEQPVTWTFTVQVPADAKPDKAIAITGGVQTQVCKEACDMPTDSSFTVTVPVGTRNVAPLKFDSAKMGSVEKEIKEGHFAVPLNKVGPKKKVMPEKKTESKATKESAALINKEVIPDTPAQIAAMARLYNVEEEISYVDYEDMDKYPIGSGGTSTGKQTSFLYAMFGAFVGGMLLNLMPCVFPVLGIKVMGFVQQGGEKASKVRMHGFAFAAGLVISMWVLAGGLLILKNAFGQNIIWGEQMANPYFVGGIIVLLFVLGLNMAGVFEFGTSMSSVGGNVSQKKGYSGSFFSGVLTTLIATPCSGPFLGTAMTYALSQTAALSMLLFTVFGLGIASPYVLLAFFPPLIKRLPKPGPWMDTFKVTMAFALFATVAWFMGVFGTQTGIDGMTWMLMGLVIVALAAYFYGVWGEPHIASSKRWAFGYLMPFIIAGFGFWLVYGAASQIVIAADSKSEVSDGPIPWVTWNPGKVKHSLNRERIVWADYTADW